LSQPVDDRRINSFQQDRKLLPYNDAEIAQLMKIGRANYSSYANGRYPITNAFLKKFYTAFEEELKELRKKDTVEEEAREYINPGSVKRAMDEWNKRANDIDNKFDRLIEGHLLLSTELRRLEKKLDDLVEIRLNKIETLLSHLATGSKNQ
jgi:transcriptional regulator with XRE-family HTH domain